MNWNFSVGLKCVLTSRTESLLNLWPLYMVVSKKGASMISISSVNLIVKWCLFACSMNFQTKSLLVCQREIMSSIQRFQASGLLALSFRLCFSISPVKILAKAIAILVPMAVRFVNLERVFLQLFLVSA